MLCARMFSPGRRREAEFAGAKIRPFLETELSAVLGKRGGVWQGENLGRAEFFDLTGRTAPRFALDHSRRSAWFSLSDSEI